MANELNPGRQPGQRGSWWAAIKSCSGTAADRRNQYWFVAWTFAWALSFVGAMWILKNATPDGVMLWLVAIVPNLFAIGAVLAYFNFLRNADELLRKIQIDGLAFGFGAALIFVMGYSLLEQAGAPRADTFMVMIVAWMIGQLIGAWRYR